MKESTPKDTPFFVEGYCRIHQRPMEPVELSWGWVGQEEMFGVACPECRRWKQRKRELDAAGSRKSREDGTVLMYSQIWGYIPPTENSERIRTAMREEWMRDWEYGVVGPREFPPNLPPYAGAPGQWCHHPFPEEVEFDEEKRQQTLALPDRDGVDFWDIGSFRPLDEDDGRVKVEWNELKEDLYLASGGECEPQVVVERYPEKRFIQYGTLKQFPDDDPDARLYRVVMADRGTALRLVSISPASRRRGARYNENRDALANLMRRMGYDNPRQRYDRPDLAEGYAPLSETIATLMRRYAPDEAFVKAYEALLVKEGTNWYLDWYPDMARLDGRIPGVGLHWLQWERGETDDLPTVAWYPHAHSQGYGDWHSVICRLQTFPKWFLSPCPSQRTEYMMRDVVETVEECLKKVGASIGLDTTEMEMRELCDDLRGTLGEELCDDIMELHPWLIMLGHPGMLSEEEQCAFPRLDLDEATGLYYVSRLLGSEVLSSCEGLLEEYVDCARRAYYEVPRYSPLKVLWHAVSLTPWSIANPYPEYPDGPRA